MDWLAACNALRVVDAKFQRWRKICTILQPWEAGPIPVEMSQTPLTNKKQGNLD